LLSRHMEKFSSELFRRLFLRGKGQNRVVLTEIVARARRATETPVSVRRFSGSRTNSKLTRSGHELRQASGRRCEPHAPRPTVSKISSPSG
jgi:hypothetical protein